MSESRHPASACFPLMLAGLRNSPPPSLLGHSQAPALLPCHLPYLEIKLAGWICVWEGVLGVESGQNCQPAGKRKADSCLGSQAVHGPTGSPQRFSSAAPSLGKRAGGGRRGSMAGACLVRMLPQPPPPCCRESSLWSCPLSPLGEQSYPGGLSCQWAALSCPRSSSSVLYYHSKHDSNLLFKCSFRNGTKAPVNYHPAVRLFLFPSPLLPPIFLSFPFLGN